VEIAQAVEAAGFSVPLTSVSVAIEGMTCAACSSRLERALGKVPGVAEASVNLATEQARIAYQQGVTSIDAVIKAIERAGFTGIAITSPTEQAAQREQDDAKKSRHDLGLIIVSALLTAPLVGDMALSFAFDGAMLLPAWVQMILASLVQGLVGWRFYKGAWASLRGGAGNMDVLVALGTSAAWGLSSWRTLFTAEAHHLALYFEASAVVLTLVLLGKWLEGRAKRGAAASIRALMALRPEIAHVEREGKIIDLPADAVRLGDTVIIRSGERVPVDGAIERGQSAIDESLLTGESLPVDKTKGDRVIAGSINGNGLLAVTADAVGADATVGRLIRMVEDAQASKAPIQHLVDRISAIFVPIILLLAAATFVGWWAWGMNSGTATMETAIAAAISVIVIACPCALGLATPTAIMVGTGVAARHGILIKNAEALERAHAVTHVIFDKTGTLTQGQPSVNSITLTAQSPVDKIQLIALAAAAQRGSEHPLARAILTYAEETLSADQHLPLDAVDHFQALTGRGLKADVAAQTLLMGNRRLMQEHSVALPSDLEDTAVNLEHQGQSVLWVALGGTLDEGDETLSVVAVIAVSDPIKSNSTLAIKLLQQQGIIVSMLTGDNKATATAVAKTLGLQDLKAEVLPEHKVEAVNQLRQKGEIIAMVGDGVNDAPALAAADVSVAMGTGSDVAMQTAAITLMRGDPILMADAISISRATYRKIQQNLFWAFGYNVVAVPLAMAGALDPMIAGAAMAFSSVSVVSNALLLRRWKPELNHA
jgi:Cu+-exporting ATPase